MIEKYIILDEVDLIMFYGVNNINLQMIKSLYPNVRIIARGNTIKVLGDEQKVEEVEKRLLDMKNHLIKYNALKEEDIIHIINGETPQKEKSQNQQCLVDDFQSSDMIFAIGPAGTGKTYLSIALAVKALKDKVVRKIILSRPAVEAGEKLGFLPGDMKEKIDPYLQPLYDSLEDMIPAVKLQDMIEKDIIQIAPLAFMRGRTLNDAIVILDEAQNTTPAQIRMFLTRMGWNTKMIITGDITQIDLPNKAKSGLKEALVVLKDVEGVSMVHLKNKDIVRHKLVTKIVNAYEKHDKEHEIIQENYINNPI